MEGGMEKRKPGPVSCSSSPQRTYMAFAMHALSEFESWLNCAYVIYKNHVYVSILHVHTS